MKIKKWNILSYFIFVVVIFFGRQIVHFITDWWWFEEIGFASLFQKSFLTEWFLGLGAAAVFWAILFGNLLIAKHRSRKPFVVIGPDVTVSSPLPLPQILEIKPMLQAALIFFTALAAFFAGQWAAGEWETLQKFLNATPFGAVDPLFSKDIGFYVFALPWYRLVFKFLTAAVALSAVVSGAHYFVNTRIYLTSRGLQMADDVKAHLAALGGFLFLMVAFYFQLSVYDLLFMARTLAPGAGYASVNAYLPALKILRFLALISAALLWTTLWRKDIKIVFGAVLLTLGGALAARVYTEIVQKFKVSPNEIVMETPFIRLAIENTREAYGLTAVQEAQFDPREDLNAGAIQKNNGTVKNIRLWEHQPLLTTFSQLQEIRTYYDFLDADNDRYWVNGEYRQVMISARELVPESLPSRIWINEHLTYTHGYGICLGPVNRISPEGLPEFFIKDIPPASSTNLKVTRPEIYFGESRASYAIVKTQSKEFDYPSGDENVYSTYEGAGGVPIKNFFRRLLFALRFGELKILFSSDLSSESRFLYYRSVGERLERALPFLRFDRDPYIVIADDGKLFWMVDGYSVTDGYPYSESFRGVNYIRNSVKATVDAYNGSISVYISSPKDPIIQTYAKIFPGVFKPLDAMPKDLRSHIRYPQTLMNIQAKVYATYHMTDPQVFYNKEDLWKIPLRTAGGRADPMEPYYTIMKLAGVGDKEEFILMVPFTPAKKENMISWLAARCDEPHYGKLLVYNFPKQKLVYGPQQIESRIDQDAEIAKQLTLWDQGGSRVLRGNLLVIPVDESLLYVQPLYLEALNGGLPELKRVIVAYGNSIAMEENLELSLARIFGGKMERRQDRDLSFENPQQNLKTAARLAREHFEKALMLQRQGDWAGYGEEMRIVEKILKNLAEQK